MRCVGCALRDEELGFHPPPPRAVDLLLNSNQSRIDRSFRFSCVYSVSPLCCIPTQTCVVSMLLRFMLSARPRLVVPGLVPTCSGLLPALTFIPLLAHCIPGGVTPSSPWLCCGFCAPGCGPASPSPPRWHRWPQHRAAGRSSGAQGFALLQGWVLCWRAVLGNPVDGTHRPSMLLAGTGGPWGAAGASQCLEEQKPSQQMPEAEVCLAGLQL